MNKFKIYGREIASLKDLADGSILLELFRIMTGDNIDSAQMIANLNDAKQRYEIIQMAIESNFIKFEIEMINKDSLRLK